MENEYWNEIGQSCIAGCRSVLPVITRVHKTVVLWTLTINSETINLVMEVEWCILFPPWKNWMLHHSTRLLN